MRLTVIGFWRFWTRPAGVCQHLLYMFLGTSACLPLFTVALRAIHAKVIEQALSLRSYNGDLCPTWLVVLAKCTKSSSISTKCAHREASHIRSLGASRRSLLDPTAIAPSDMLQPMPICHTVVTLSLSQHLVFIIPGMSSCGPLCPSRHDGQHGREEYGRNFTCLWNGELTLVQKHLRCHVCNSVVTMAWMAPSVIRQIPQVLAQRVQMTNNMPFPERMDQRHSALPREWLIVPTLTATSLFVLAIIWSPLHDMLNMQTNYHRVLQLLSMIVYINTWIPSDADQTALNLQQISKVHQRCKHLFYTLTPTRTRSMSEIYISSSSMEFPKQIHATT